MAITTFLMTVSMVAIASAGFPGWPDNDNPFPGFHQPVIPTLRFGSVASPPLFQNFPFFQFPVFPSMPSFPPMPSVSDIASAVPSNGGSFSGVIVTTKKEAKRKEDGTIVTEGGSTILINQDGVVKVEKTGDSPPELPIATKSSPSFDFDAPKIKPFKSHKFNNFDDFKDFEDDFGQFRHKLPIFDTFVAPLEPEELRSYAPDKGESFKGHAVRSHSYSSNVNGDITQGASLDRIDNDNGHVDEKNIAYHKTGI